MGSNYLIIWAMIAVIVHSMAQKEILAICSYVSSTNIPELDANWNCTPKISLEDICEWRGILCSKLSIVSLNTQIFGKELSGTIIYVVDNFFKLPLINNRFNSRYYWRYSYAHNDKNAWK